MIWWNVKAFQAGTIHGGLVYEAFATAEIQTGIFPTINLAACTHACLSIWAMHFGTFRVAIEFNLTGKLLFDLLYLDDVGTSSNTQYDHLLNFSTVFCSTQSRRQVKVQVLQQKDWQFRAGKRGKLKSAGLIAKANRSLTVCSSICEKIAC